MSPEPGILLLTLCFRAPWCRSLKDRRSEVMRLTSRLRSRFNVSVVESGGQQTHTLFDITCAALTFDAAQADSIRQNILDFVEGITQADLYDIQTDHL